jgi:energy-coupling factor transport system ATP-binding protein
MIEILNLIHKSLNIPYLTIPKGHTTVIGPNGSGKTTLLDLCAGIQIPEQGCIQIEQMEPRSRDVGYVCEFPDRNILFERVDDEIASPLRFRLNDCEAIRTRIRTLSEMIPISMLLDASTHDLSGGEKALIAVATAIAASPTLLVLDESDSHLDFETRGMVQHLIRSLTVPYVLQCTQDMDIAAGSDHVLYCSEGTIRYSGRPQEVFSHLRKTCFFPRSWRNPV